MSERTLTILYGSQTGNAELVAMDAADAGEEAGLDVTLSAFDEVDPSVLDGVGRVLIVTSTYDDGDMPDNAQEFWDALCLDGPDLGSVEYAVLALGDSSYDDFCAAGRCFDEKFDELGAIRWRPRLECDIDYEVPAQGWLRDLFVSLGSAEAAPAAVPEPERATPERAWTRQEPYVARIVASRSLSAPGSDKSVFHLEVAVDPDEFSFAAGDSVGVVVDNDPDLVDQALVALGVGGDDPVPGRDRNWREFLTDETELRLPPRDLVELVRAHAPQEVPAPDDRHAVAAWLWGKDVVDLLALVPGKVTPEAFLEVAKPLQHREYSVASSPVADPPVLALMVAEVEYGAGDRVHRGAGSSYLIRRCQVGRQIEIFGVPNPSFKLPAPGTDIIMIGPGTGLAPFRGFLQEREATRAAGRNWLFFGDRREEVDFAYRDEITAWADAGTLDRVSLAFSRDQADKIYVQDRLRERGKEILSWLDAGASVYVCGDMTAMAPDVDRALIDVVAEHGGLDEEAATDYVAALRRDRRYLKDVY